MPDSKEKSDHADLLHKTLYDLTFLTVPIPLLLCRALHHLSQAGFRALLVAHPHSNPALQPPNDVPTLPPAISMALHTCSLSLGQPLPSFA